MTVRTRPLAAVAAVAATVSLAATPSGAAAPDIFFSRTSGTIASANWIETDPIAPGQSPVGNTHVGFLTVEAGGSSSPTFVFGAVEDYDCDPGEVPGGGHGGGQGTCDPIGVRFLDGQDVTFTVDRKFTSARLTGTLRVSAGHDGTPLATPPVDMTWTGVGDLSKSTSIFRYVDETSAFYSKEVRNGRTATVAGRIGPMNFTDDPDDVSAGFLGTYKVVSRSRS